MSFARSLSLLVALAVLGTSACMPPPPEPPPTILDAGSVAEEPTCRGACDRWRALGCAEAEDTAGGGTCEQVCENVQTSGIIEWDLACRSSVTDCGAIDACER